MEISRIRREEVPAKRRWDASAVSELEKRKIVKWIEDQARLNLQKKNATRESALRSSNVVAMEIAGLFAVREENRDLQLIEDAGTGGLERKVPKLALIKTYNFLRWTLFSLELAVFVGLVAFQGADPAVLISGVLLAVSGFAVGHGVGQLMGDGDNRRERLIHYVWLFAGLVGIAAITYMRASFGGEGALNVVLITLAIAFLIAIFEAAYQYSSERYSRIWDRMYMAQVWIATARHLKDQESGFWKEKYEDELWRLINASSEVEDGRGTEDK